MARSRKSLRAKSRFVKLKRSTSIRPDVDPHLQWVLYHARNKTRPDGYGLRNDSSGELNVDVVAELRDPHTKVTGLIVHSVIGRFVTGSVVVAQLEKIRMDPNVISLKCAVGL